MENHARVPDFSIEMTFSPGSISTLPGFATSEAPSPVRM